MKEAVSYSLCGQQLKVSGWTEWNKTTTPNKRTSSREEYVAGRSALSESGNTNLLTAVICMSGGECTYVTLSCRTRACLHVDIKPINQVPPSSQWSLIFTMTVGGKRSPNLYTVLVVHSDKTTVHLLSSHLYHSLPIARRPKISPEASLWVLCLVMWPKCFTLCQTEKLKVLFGTHRHIAKQ